MFTELHILSEYREKKFKVRIKPQTDGIFVIYFWIMQELCDNLLKTALFQSCDPSIIDESVCPHLCEAASQMNKWRVNINCWLKINSDHCRFSCISQLKTGQFIRMKTILYFLSWNDPVLLPAAHQIQINIYQCQEWGMDGKERICCTRNYNNS